MLATRPKVALRACTDDPSWLCGSIRVPIDRAHPAGRSLSIGFTVFPHTNPASPLPDAIFVSDGGPGAANIPGRGFRLFMLGPLTDRRDMVLVDNRGTGISGAIDCPRLQNGDQGGESAVAAAAACGRQLGVDADRYGSGDVALDLEDVRRALGYRQIDYYAQSYGSVDIQAYAVRFPHRLRAVVVDAGLPVSDPAHVWTWGFGIPAALVRSTALACQRAPACAAAHADAERALGNLARRLRHQPVEGVVRDANGKLHRVRVNELKLTRIASFQALDHGELAAAADALAAGDKAPLLRMASEVSGPGGRDDPAQYSQGDNAAAFCNDTDFVWSRTDPIPVRRAKYDRALARLGPHAFAPFSISAWSEFFITDFCLRWPAPDRFTPAVPHASTVTGVPALILSGDLDTDVPTEITRRLLSVFPHATLLRVAGAAHPAAGWSECARTAMQGFIRSLQAAGTTCKQPAYVPPAVPQFPVNSAAATPATALPQDGSDRRDRQVATTAVDAVRDAWLRSFRIPGALGTDTGLRGGTFTFDYARFADHAVIRLTGARFTRDVTVNGTSSWHYATNGLRMHFRCAARRVPAVS